MKFDKPFEIDEGADTLLIDGAIVANTLNVWLTEKT